MVFTECPHCKARQSFARHSPGKPVRCVKCGRAFALPAPKFDEQGRPLLAPGTPMSQDEMDLYLNPALKLTGAASFLLGVLLPLGIAGWAVWRGFMLRDIYVPGASRHAVTAGWWAKGDAALWAGAGTLCLAALSHAAFFWAPKKRYRTAAVVAVVLCLGAFLFFTFMASASGL